MNDLAKEHEKESPCNIESDKPSYPTLCLYGSQVASFLDGNRIEMGKVYEVTIRCKMEGWRETPHTKSLDLCVLSSDDITEVGAAEDTDEGSDPVESAASYKA